MFRLPLTAVDLDGLRAYAPGGPVTLIATGEYAVLDLWSETEEPEDDWFEAGQLAASLTPAGAPTGLPPPAGCPARPAAALTIGI